MTAKFADTSQCSAAGRFVQIWQHVVAHHEVEWLVGLEIHYGPLGPAVAIAQVWAYFQAMGCCARKFALQRIEYEPGPTADV